MSFSCFKASDPNVTSADVLYLPDKDDQNLWTDMGPAALCSSVSPPAPTQCLVCFQESLYAVCSKLLEKTPVMEGGENIQIAPSACPTFLTEDDQTWWIILLAVIVLFIIVILGVVICKRDKICSTFQRFRALCQNPFTF